MNNKYLIKLFFLICLLTVNRANELDINSFYEPSTDNPCITFDPTYNTAFYLNRYNPNILSDYQILDINIDGSNLSPLGSYIISPLYKIFIKDSLSSTAFEHNRGDYAHNENIIFINNKYKNNLSSFFMAQSKKYDGLQSINSNSDALQNYFLNIAKNYSHSNTGLITSLSSSIMYHKENTTIPINTGSYIRSSEDFLSGYSIKTNYMNLLKLNISNSFQIKRQNLQNDLFSDNHNIWFDINGELRLNKFINIMSSYKRKHISFDSKINQIDFSYNEVILNEFSFSAQLKHQNYILNSTLIFYDQKNSAISDAFSFNSPRFNFNLIYNLNKVIEISINRASHSFVNGFSNTLFDLMTLKINYSNVFLKFIIEPFQLTSYSYNPEQENADLATDGKINGINTLISFKNNYFISDINSSFYNSNYRSPINFYSNYSILFAPKINNKRFRPFIGLSGSFINLNESSYIDIGSESNFFPFLNNTFENSVASNSKNVNLLNIELGIIINQFKVSYHFTNPFNDDILLSFSDSYQNIGPFSKLQVTWQFLD